MQQSQMKAIAGLVVQVASMLLGIAASQLRRREGGTINN